MDWVSTAILSAAVFGIANIVDSHLLSRRKPGLRVFLLFAGIPYLLYSLILFYRFPFPEGIGPGPLLAAIVSGILRATGVTLLIVSLQKEEVSRVMPVFHTYPIYVAIMAIPLLGESLHFLQWLAIIIVVAGAAIISGERPSAGSTSRLSRSFIIVVLSCLLVAAADITSKYALGYLTFWNLYGITILCMGALYWMVSIRPGTFRKIREMKQKRATITTILANHIVTPVAIGLMFLAMSGGPIALVSTILSSRPIFILIDSLIAGLLFPGFLLKLPGTRGIIIRFIATAMIVGGVTIIYLA